MLPFLAELAEHRQHAIASLASHLVEAQEQEDTMTAEEIDHLRDLEYQARQKLFAEARKNSRILDGC